MKNDAARLRKLRRKVYRQFPVASASRIAVVDPDLPYAALKAAFAGDDSGVLGAGAALALWRALTERGIRAWCYEFGFAESLTHRVVIAAIDGRLQVHDPLFNLTYTDDFFGVLDILRDGRLPAVSVEWRDRTTYVADPAGESAAALRWLEIHSDAELTQVGSLRRFELLWTEEALGATRPQVAAARRTLVARGHPGDLRFLMLHPLAMFDGTAEHRDLATMPLIGGRDLGSRFAELRVAERGLAAAHEANRGLAARLASTAAAVAAKAEEAARLDSQLVQMRAALDDAAHQAQTDAAARLALERREAAWGAERGALVGAAASAAGDADLLRGEIALLQTRLSAAEARAAAGEAALAEQTVSAREQRHGQAAFAAAASRLLDDETAAAAGAAVVLDRIHEKLLETELARDRARSERDRAADERDRLAAIAASGRGRWRGWLAGLLAGGRSPSAPIAVESSGRRRRGATDRAAAVRAARL